MKIATSNLAPTAARLGERLLALGLVLACGLAISGCGGFGGTGGGGCSQARVDWDTVQVYNPAKDRWTLRKTKMPVRAGRTRAATVEDWIYVLDGRWGGTEIYRYEPQTETWETVPQAPRAMDVRFDLVGTKTDLYVLLDLTPTFDTGVDVLDTVAMAWTTGPDATGVHRFGVQMAGEVYALGANSDGLARLDPVAGAWVGLAPMPAGFTPQGAESDGLRIMAFDGTNRQTVMYDPSLDTWSAGPDMPSAFEFYDTAVIGDRIYLVKPAPRRGHGTLSYDFVTGGWKKGSSVERYRDWAGAAAWNDRIFIFGGITPNGCYK